MWEQVFATSTNLGTKVGSPMTGDCHPDPQDPESDADQHEDFVLVEEHGKSQEGLVIPGGSWNVNESAGTACE